MSRYPAPAWWGVVACGLLAGCHTCAQSCYFNFLGRASQPADVVADSHIRQVADKQVTQTELPLPIEVDGQKRFAVPSELPGSSAAPLQLPPIDASQSPAERRSVMQAMFPGLPGTAGIAEPSSDQAMGLAELQELALRHSPVVQQAAAEVEAARGAAVQAGLYPNPTVGYEGDSLGTANTAGYNGLFITQEFVTAGKLSLAQCAALMEMRAAEQDLRKARIALASDVRRGYFQVLIAQEQLKFSRAISRLSADVYQAQIDLVTAGEAAPYEPLQLRVFAIQARNGVVEAENGLLASWRQLAASVGLPQLQRSELLGSAEMPVPTVDYDAAVGFLLSRHTDLSAAQARINGACYNVQLQEAIPIPNVTVYGTFQHDDTSPLNDFASNIQVSVPVPLFDRNEGNISSAHARLTQRNQDLTAARNSLMSQLADTYNRYATSKVIAESYRVDVLQDQVRVYRGIYDRFRQAGGDVDFAQVVVGQQTLANAVKEYLTALQNQWRATVDLAELLQVDDLFQMEQALAPAAAPVMIDALPDAPAVPVEIVPAGE
ncbi:MAG: TolC family protein [Planctomycetaceae bacterium]|nr:TolC family protein [Planctomycetaceae bacterium]